MIQMEPEELQIKLMMENAGSGGTDDYLELRNKPSINGTELTDNYDEIDPTVPSWAKEPNKPTYTAEEIGALDENNEMTLTQVSNIWNQVFRNNGGN